MSDWKGSKVWVTVTTKRDYVTEFKTFLDTDTLNDVFDEYDPNIHVITIEPNEELDD